MGGWTFLTTGKSTKTRKTASSSGEEFWFDDAAADRAVRFFEKYLRHVKGQWAGQRFVLAPWQRDRIIRPLFGWKRADGTRRYRIGYIGTGKKNGKSTLAAGIGAYLTFADREEGGEVYSAAGDREQASIIFEIGKKMVARSAPLRRRSEPYRRSIVVPATGTSWKVVSADAPRQHGINPSAVLFDELHVQPDRDLWDAFETALAARRQPLMLAFTTAGVDRESICFEQYDYARKVRDGVIEDPSFFVFIAEANEADDWEDPATWAKANPGLGVTVSLDFLQGEARKAKQLPAYQNAFRRFHLNQWVQQLTRWIAMSLWHENAGPPIDPAALSGRACVAGLDLASVSDLVAWVLLFPDPQDRERITMVPRFWCPEARLTDTRNRYRAQYQAWQATGLLTATPGESTDFAFVRAQILADAQTYRIQEIGIDRFQAEQLASELAHEGLTVVAVGQGFYGMAAPMREFERRLLARKIHHGGHPVLRWMADNVAVKMDPAGNLKPDKASSQGKIDGIVATLNALARLIVQPEQKGSVYESRGFRTLS